MDQQPSKFSERFGLDRYLSIECSSLFKAPLVYGPPPQMAFLREDEVNMNQSAPKHTLFL